MEEDIKILEQTIKLNGKRIQPEIINAMENLMCKAKEQEKIIELMAKDIAENKLDEDICRKVKNPKKEDCYADMYDACYGCVIEYYEKKAKG